MRALGARLAACLQAGDCLAFHGTLGAGKTTLIRGVLQALMGPSCEVPSPTFTLVQTYEPSPPLPMIWHFDLYRLTNPHDVMELGWESALDDIALIEWPERAGNYLPRWALALEIAFSGDSGRQITFLGKDWGLPRFSPLFG